MSSENSVITTARRANLAKITSGAITTIPKIAFMAFGDGGAQADGTPIPPVESATALAHEIARYPVETPTYPVETTVRYTAVIPEEALAGQSISEVALVDEAGTLCTIKTMRPKQKDGDVKFTFVFDDEF